MTQRGGRSSKAGGTSLPAPARSTDERGSPAGDGAGSPRTTRRPLTVTGGTTPAPPPRNAAADGSESRSGGAEPAAGAIDVVYVHEPNEAGDGYHVLRQRQERFEVGEIRPLRQGRPIQGELVRLTPRQEGSRLFDVDVLYEPPRAPAHAGPAHVTSEHYRHGWDEIFGRTDGRQRGGDGGVN